MVFSKLLKKMASANSPKGVGNLTLDKAAFLLIRIKRIFVKKKNKARAHLEKIPSKKKPPLLRARTLPAIICPSLNIIQAQLDGTNIESEEQGGGSELKPRRHFSGSAVIRRKNVAQERERCYLDPEFEPVKSPLGSPRPSLASVTSTQSTLSAGGRDKQKYEITKAGLARFAKRLTSKDKSTNKVIQQFPSIIPNIEVTPLRRSGSVDSLMESNFFSIDASDGGCSLAPSCSSSNLSPDSSLLAPPTPSIPTSPSVPAKLEAHRRGDIPSSPSVPNKLTKGLSGQCLENPEVLLEGLPLSKTEIKRLEKLNKINIDLQALFVAVEHEHLERARSILSTTDVNVNCVNNDGFTPLDIAVMILDISMAKLLQSYGARESTRFRSKESKLSQLLVLVKEAERCVEDLTTCVLSTAASGSLSMALLKEKEKQLNLWRRRQTLLRRMKSGFEKLKTPLAPPSVTLEVVGTKALKVKFTENESARDPETIVTKYKVEWSVRPDFHPLSGSREMMNLQRLEMVLSDLIHGVPYCVRVAAGNSKGYSPYTTATPPSAAPSSWMDVNGRKSRSLGRLCQLDCVFHQIIFTRPPCSSEIKDILFGNTLETPQQQRRQVRKSIKNLFAPTPKFQKNMKRGIYLACLMYTDHRVLVTTEDTLPIMEVDETCPSCLHNDFHWLMKVACTWEDAKVLRAEMEKTQSSSAIHFRSKLLHAAEMMQNALGVQDLGQFYYKPIKDPEDTTVLCTVKHVPDSKSLNNLSLRWVPLAKLQRKLSINSESSHDVCTVNSLLLSATQAMMAYNHMSRIALPKGLYVAYVKISSSVDLIRVLVPKKAPNVLPYYKVRENPHVSAEEWEWIKMLSSETRGAPTAAQLKFQKVLSSATRNLLTLLEVTSDHIGEHRLYDTEVIELNSEVSLVLLLPPVDSVCSAPGQRDDVTERTDCVLLPLQIFEMIHMSTYQHLFISRYSRISSILEMDTLVAQHIHRQAFSKTELASAQSRLRQLQQFQTQVDNTWRSMRWLMDVLNFAREKHAPGGLLLLHGLLVEQHSPCTTPPHSPRHSQSLHTLQVPPLHEPPLVPLSGSSSSFSLSADHHRPPPTHEIRRCASTSGLVSMVTEPDELPPAPDHPSAYSTDTLSVTYKLGSSCHSDRYDDEHDQPESIVINVTPGCDHQSMTNLDDLEDDGDYREQGMDDLLLLAPPGDDDQQQQQPPSHSDDEDDSLTDCGLQFKAIPLMSDGEEEEDEEAFIAAILDSEEVPPSEGEECEQDELRVAVSYCAFGPSVRLKVHPDATAREIVEAVVQQVNDAAVASGGEAIDETSFVDEKNVGALCLVVSFDAAAASERFLSDSFQPLKVQNPWTKGRLSVRYRTDACTPMSEP